MRKIHPGKLGGPILGSLQATSNTVSSLQADTDIVLSPDGTGITRCDSHLQLNTLSELRFGDGDNAQYVGMKAASDVTSYTLTLPATAPAANGHALLVNTDGTTSFGDFSIETTNNTTDSGAYYVAIMDDADADDGSITGLTYSDNKLEFVPSTGTLSPSNLSTGNITATGTSTLTTVDINGGNIDGTTIGAASAANATFASMTATSITETSSITLKENVNPIENALDTVMQLAGVTYDRKDGSSKMEAGLIKEEVEKILPNVVKDNGIQYTKLTAYLIEAVKTLTQEVNELKNRG